MRKKIKVLNIECTQCAKTIEKHFEKFDELTASVNVNTKEVVFEYDDLSYDLKFITNELIKIGYHPVLENDNESKRSKRALIELIISIIITIPLVYSMLAHIGFSFLVPSLLQNWYFQLILASIVQVYFARSFYYRAFNQLKSKNLGMDVLVVLGTSIAFLYSLYLVISKSDNKHLFFESSATIITMVLVGNFLENKAKKKSESTLYELLSLESHEARIALTNTFVPINEVKIDEEILVLANEKVPLDGIIISGASHLDEMTMTGESFPKKKQNGDFVYASSINLSSSIVIKVKASKDDTVLAKIIKTVEDTAKIKPRVQRIADKIASIFVPIVFLIAIITFLVWAFIVNKGNYFDAFSKAISVLVISCPCALGLATPTSIAVSSNIAFVHGIVYKGGEFFEILPHINVFAFDKTGTLTFGNPSVINYFGDLKDLKITASIEKHSNHPISKAIINYYQKNDYFVATNQNILNGIGIKAEIDDIVYYVGSKKLLTNLKLENPFNEEFIKASKRGMTSIFTVSNNRVYNMITIYDKVRESAKEVIEILKKRKIEVIMVSGDLDSSSSNIGKSLLIDCIYSEVLPLQKSEIISNEQKKGNRVAFIGDGINDAVALKQADISFAVKNGNDIAINSADVTFLNDDLSLIIKAIDISKATVRNIYQNFVWAFSYNLVMIPLAAFGIFNPLVSGIGMSVSSIIVVLNALRLKFIKFDRRKK